MLSGLFVLLFVLQIPLFVMWNILPEVLPLRVFAP